MTMNNETKAIKKALKDAGYPVTSCSHGRGTAYSWIEIRIDDYQEVIRNGQKTDQSDDVYKIVRGIIGRTDQVLVSWSKHHLCKECLISNCERYHTPDSCACGGFCDHERSELLEKQHRDFMQRREADKTDPITVEYYNDVVEIRNVSGALFTIPKTRFDDLVIQGKTKDQVFDLLCLEDLEFKKAEKYRKECEATREGLGHPWVYHGDGTRDNIGGPRPEDPVKAPYEVREIKIDDWNGSVFFDSFYSANAWLRKQAEKFPAGGGYSKLNFRVVFGDGQDYSGRLDCKHSSEPDNDLDLFKHILEHLTFYSGRLKKLPDHITHEDYQRILKDTGADKVRQAGEFIDKYLSPRCACGHVFNDRDVSIVEMALPGQDYYDGNMYVMTCTVCGLMTEIREDYIPEVPA